MPEKKTGSKKPKVVKETRVEKITTSSGKKTLSNKEKVNYRNTETGQFVKAQKK